jgi:hypothetical protein
MALFNLFKPKWQHSDPTVRLKAVAELPVTDQQTLVQIAGGDSNHEVRRAALARVNDMAALSAPAGSITEPTINRELSDRIDELRLSELLAAQAGEAKMALLSLITKDALLARVAVEEADPEIRMAAVERMVDQELLAHVVTQNCGKAPALLAIEKISDESLLRRAAEQASSRSARARAQQKVDEIEAERNRPSIEALREQELAGILEQARQLSEATDLDQALARCRKLQKQWREIAVKEDQRGEQLEAYCAAIQTGQQEELARQEASRAAERAQEQQLERLRQIVGELEALSTSVTGNEENTLAKLDQEWTALQESSAGDLLSDDLRQCYEEATEAFNRSRTLLAQELAEEARQLETLNTLPPLLAGQDLQQALALLGEAQHAFDGWHPQLVSRKPVAERLVALRDQQRKAEARLEQGRAARLQANLERRQELLQELKGLLTAEDLAQAEQRVKEIKKLWGQAVELPAEADGLELEFAETAKLFAEKFAASNKQKAWQRWQNKNLKSQLIVEAEALDNDSDLRQVFKRIKELQESWRNLGPAPAKEENALWRKFHQATDRNFARCRAFFQTLEAEAEHNLQEKARLRDLAIALQDSTEWQKSAESIKELQLQWKTIGRGPQEKEQEVYQAFRAACDHFFERRKAHHQTLDQERLANLEQKEALCLQAEALADQPDRNHSQKFQELQRAWKAIGPVPKESQDAIWARFRAACDRYYAWLDALRPENLSQKEALCLEVEGLTAAIGPATNFIQVAKKIVALQRRWKEIGPVPEEQQESIWQRFKGQCDVFYAVKARHEEAIDQERPANQARKESMLARVKELSEATVSRESVKEIIALQEEWQHIGPASKESEAHLQQEFKATCGTFFKERREAFEEIDQLHRENHKQKEKLCLRLEILAGITPQSAIKAQARKGGLSLAEQLKVAFETNFVLSAPDSRDKKRRAKDEIESVRHEWQKIGPVPREHEHAILRRYNEAMAAALKV